MINNLEEFFQPKQGIFLDTISYKRIENDDVVKGVELSLLCQDNIRVLLEDDGVEITLTRSVKFEPPELFELVVSYRSLLSFNEKKDEIDWSSINLAEEFRENGAFVTTQLMSRIALLIGEITSSYGQEPLILPPRMVKERK